MTMAITGGQCGDCELLRTERIFSAPFFDQFKDKVSALPVKATGRRHCATTLKRSGNQGEPTWGKPGRGEHYERRDGYGVNIGCARSTLVESGKRRVVLSAVVKPLDG
jgi:hypothetical protein